MRDPRPRGGAAGVRGDARRLRRVALSLLGALTLAIASPSLPAEGEARRSLERFFTEVETFQATFDQVVLDEGFNRVEESSGVMWIARPGRFRWDYRPPTEQYIVSDGGRVWVYDVDLEQVTVRNLTSTLGRTPAILLAGEGDIDRAYSVRDIGPQGPLDWVGLAPRDPESNFDDVRIGFEGPAMRIIELVDGLGQTTRITLTRAKENPVLLVKLFEFTPPPGVDVLDETE